MASPSRAGPAGVALAALIVAACGSGGEGRPPPVAVAASPSTTATAPTVSGSPSRAPTPAAAPSAAPQVATAADPVISAVPIAQWRRMVEAGMAYAGCPLTRGDLRRVHVNHLDFAGRVQRGTLVVNADVAESIARIFTALFDLRFPIERMRPVEAYDGDSDASLRDNNTAAYNCRRPDQINAPQLKSPHANGRAIDINPERNPWMDLRCTCWSPGARYAERTPGKGKILFGGGVWRTFLAEGWIWQNIDVPDYMHFDTGYPSVPFDGRG
jgi:hypothetical protein